METLDEFHQRRPAAQFQHAPEVNEYDDDEMYEPESPLDAEPPDPAPLHEPPAVANEQPEKKQKVEEFSYVASVSEDGVHRAPGEHEMLWLYQAIAEEDHQWDCFQTVLASDMEALTMEFDLDFPSNRSRKDFLHNPAAAGFFVLAGCSRGSWLLQKTNKKLSKMANKMTKRCTLAMA
jgi:hypothetical protein